MPRISQSSSSAGLGFPDDPVRRPEAFFTGQLHALQGVEDDHQGTSQLQGVAQFGESGTGMAGKVFAEGLLAFPVCAPPG